MVDTLMFDMFQFFVYESPNVAMQWSDLVSDGRFFLCCFFVVALLLVTSFLIRGHGWARSTGILGLVDTLRSVVPL